MKTAEGPGTGLSALPLRFLKVLRAAGGEGHLARLALCCDGL